MRSASFILVSVVSALFSGVASGAHVVWSQPSNSTFTAPQSTVTTSPAASLEAADDFEVNGTVERLVISGNDCFQCMPPTVTGAYVRFYTWTASGPGQLQSEYFISSGGSGLLYNAASPAGLDITLPQPFAATGRHYLSVQLSIDGSGFWGWWISNNDNPRGSALWHRTDGGEWGQYISVGTPVNADLAFMLWGDDGNPPAPGSDPCGDWIVTPTGIPDGANRGILSDVDMGPDGDAWTVGEYTIPVLGGSETRTLVQHWDGSAWTIMNSPNPSACAGCTYATFEAVEVIAPDNIIAAGGKRMPGNDGFMGTQIFVARYNGSSWTVVNTPLTTGGNGSRIEDIVYISDSEIWLIGDQVGVFPQGGASYRALAMKWDGGSNFVVTTTPFPGVGTPGFGLMAASAVSSNDIWAVGGGSDGDYLGNNSYIIHWNGSSWTHVPGPHPGTYNRLYDVLAIASDDVWAVGDYFQAGEGYYSLFLHWDGSTWTQVESPGGGRKLIAFASDNVYCGGYGIVRWNGESWDFTEQFNSVIGPSVTAIAANEVCDIVAVGRQVVVDQIVPFAARVEPGAIGAFTNVIGDLNGDNHVNVTDLFALLAAWGDCPKPCSPTGGTCPADIAGSAGAGRDCVVNVNDLFMLLASWG